MNYKRYAIIVLLAGLAAAAAGGFLWGGSWDLTSVMIITLCVALATLTRAFPLKMSPQAEASLFGAPIFMATLLVSPLQAAMVAGLGSAAADLWLRRSPRIWTFNAGVAILAVSLAGIFYHGYHGLAGDTPGALLNPSTMAVAAVAGLILQTVNLAAMMGMISLRKGMSFWTLWQRTWVLDTIQESGTVVLGFLGAVLVAEAWWSVFLLVTPLTLTHLALGRSVKEARENIQLAQQLKTQMEELRTTQEQLIQSAKMASIGTLAAGVAHEINNPLFVMMGRAELLLKHKDRHLRSERARLYIQTIHEQGARAAQIVRDLLVFSRDGSPVQPVKVSEAIDKAVSLLGKAGSNQTVVQIKREYAADLPAVDAVETKLQQVFLNLMQNARDAMPEGGSIYVRCWVEDGYVKASVRDTGQGIPKHVMHRLFEPFFTTKEVGQGTGLGLFICHRIVTEHHGRIKINSEEGRGTEVLVEFPASKAETPVQSVPTH